MNLKEYFQYLLEHRSEIENISYTWDTTLDLDLKLDINSGLCINVVEYTSYTNEEVLQMWFRKYFKTPNDYEVSDYPFGKGDRDARYDQYLSTSNLYDTSEYGQQRWDFIQYVVNNFNK